MPKHTKDSFKPPGCAPLETQCGVKVQDRDHKITRSAACLDEVEGAEE